MKIDKYFDEYIFITNVAQRGHSDTSDTSDISDASDTSNARSISCVPCAWFYGIIILINPYNI